MEEREMMYEENNGRVEETCVPEEAENEKSGAGILGVVIGVGALAAGVAGVIHACKKDPAKNEERKAKKLEKKIENLKKQGYVVYKKKAVEEPVVESEDSEETTE